MKLKLESARKIKGITAEKMAEAIGVSKDTYVRLEKNPETFRIDQMIKICVELNMKMDDLDLFYRLKAPEMSMR